MNFLHRLTKKSTLTITLASLLLTLAFQSIPLSAQSQEKRTTHMAYTVSEDMSIYVLARMLRFPVDSLYDWNPHLTSYLKAGTEVRTKPLNRDIQMIEHIVQDERSSLKDLALVYGLEYKSLKEANPQIRNRVWFGQVVNIPVLKLEEAGKELLVAEAKEDEQISDQEPEADDGASCRKDPRNRNTTYKVGLLVPFSLEKEGLIDTLLSVTPAEMMNLPSFRFIQFYQGFLLAADTLAAKGLNLELQVYDVDQAVSKSDDLIKNRALEDVDIIVGPFYKNPFSLLADYARDHQIPILNPLSPREDILKGNPFVFKMLPSKMSQLEQLGKLVDYRFRTHQVIIVKENKYQGVEYVDSVRISLNKLLNRDIPVIDYNTDSIPGVRAHLSATSPNLVIIYAESEVLPVELLPLLNEMDKEKNITIIGLPEWDKFGQLENHYLLNLDAHFFSQQYIDYHEPAIKKFILSFRSRYHAEPLDYAYDGFDAGCFFLSALMEYGRDFYKCAELINYPLLQTRFRFKKTPFGGFDNSYWNIYHFEDHQLVKIPDYN